MNLLKFLRSFCSPDRANSTQSTPLPACRLWGCEPLEPRSMLNGSGFGGNQFGGQHDHFSPDFGRLNSAESSRGGYQFQSAGFEQGRDRMSGGRDFDGFNNFGRQHGPSSDFEDVGFQNEVDDYSYPDYPSSFENDYFSVPIAKQPQVIIVFTPPPALNSSLVSSNNGGGSVQSLISNNPSGGQNNRGADDGSQLNSLLAPASPSREFASGSVLSQLSLLSTSLISQVDTEYTTEDEATTTSTLDTKTTDESAEHDQVAANATATSKEQKAHEESEDLIELENQDPLAVAKRKVAIAKPKPTTTNLFADSLRANSTQSFIPETSIPNHLWLEAATINVSAEPIDDDLIELIAVDQTAARHDSERANVETSANASGAVAHLEASLGFYQAADLETLSLPITVPPAEVAAAATLPAPAGK